MVPTFNFFSKVAERLTSLALGRFVVAIAVMLPPHLLLLVKLPFSGVREPMFKPLKNRP